jgi:hypothetical protein
MKSGSFGQDTFYFRVVIDDGRKNGSLRLKPVQHTGQVTRGIILQRGFFYHFIAVKDGVLEPGISKIKTDGKRQDVNFKM